MKSTTMNNPLPRDVPVAVRRLGIDACYSFRELIVWLRPKYGVRGARREATRMLLASHSEART